MNSTTQLLSLQQAFECMFRFLDRYYDETTADDIGALLSGLTMMDDGNTADPAYGQEWLQVVRSVLDESGPPQSSIK